jgi:hypothetical protein
MAFAIKAEVCDPRAKTFAFTAQKTMYGGKHIAEGDTVFVFASENEGGQGLIARGVVTSAVVEFGRRLASLGRDLAATWAMTLSGGLNRLTDLATNLQSMACIAGRVRCFVARCFM